MFTTGSKTNLRSICTGLNMLRQKAQPLTELSEDEKVMKETGESKTKLNRIPGESLFFFCSSRPIRARTNRPSSSRNGKGRQNQGKHRAAIVWKRGNVVKEKNIPASNDKKSGTLTFISTLFSVPLSLWMFKNTRSFDSI